MADRTGNPSNIDRLEDAGLDSLLAFVQGGGSQARWLSSLNLKGDRKERYRSFRTWLDMKPNARARIKEAQALRSDAWVEDAVSQFDVPMMEKEELDFAKAKAKVQMDAAKMFNPGMAGSGRKDAGKVSILNLGEIHLTQVREANESLKEAIPARFREVDALPAGTSIDGPEDEDVEDAVSFLLG